MFRKHNSLVAGCAIAGMLAACAFAQYGGGGTTGGTPSGGVVGTTGAAVGYNFSANYHIGFDRPEAWGLKYFASASLLSGLQPPDLGQESHHVGSINIGFETGWLPNLDEGQTRIGFNGKAPQDLNKAPIFARPVIRVGLPGKFTGVVAFAPPFELFGVTSHLVAFGLERPLVERQRWTLGWRGYGQVGNVKGAFTCPKSVLAFEPGSAGNPTECVGESADTATLRYAGSEFQFSYRPASMPKMVPHVAVGGNFIDGAFHVHAPVEDGMDNTRMWTRGGTLSTSAGVGYMITKRAAFVVDVFYSPLWVQRAKGTPTTNDGLFNVRAMVSYSIR